MIKGNLRKLVAEYNSPINYHLTVADEQVPLNPYIGQALQLRFTGNIHCINCDARINKSFNQGYCFACFKRLAACDICIMRPEDCHYAQGTCRDEAWAQQFCMQSHVVYLANSSALKVGITRKTQLPTRWIDQGAEQALPIFEVSSRWHSGVIESTLKKYVSDRTNWRLMLQSSAQLLDLSAERDRLLQLAAKDLKQACDRAQFQPKLLLNEAELKLEYPVLSYPVKVNSRSFEKTPVVEGALLGVKGQYLIFDTGVLNIRKYAGYQLSVTKI